MKLLLKMKNIQIFIKYKAKTGGSDLYEKSLPIGINDFKTIIEEDFYYFDKTNFISNIWEERIKGS